MGESEFLFASDEDIVDYVFQRLMKEGIVVKREDIQLILDLETDFILENGEALIIEDDKDEY